MRTFRKLLLPSVILLTLSLQGCATHLEDLLLGGAIGGLIVGSAASCSRNCY